MNEQVRAVFNMCDGFQSELDRIHKAEAEHEQAHHDTAVLYQAELIDHALRGERIHYAGTHTHSPVGIIADEMDEEDHHEMILCVLNVRAGRMTAERAIEILADKVDSAIHAASISYADLVVGK